MRRGDIYLVSLDPSAGHEQRGSRPVLVISATEFNNANRLLVISAITRGGEFARRNGFAVPISGIETKGIVRCDQPRVIDLDTRQARKVGTLPKSLMEEALARLVPIFS